MTEQAALIVAAGSAVFFGTALVTAKVGLRSLDARAGAAISIPTATVLLLAAAPFTVDPSGFSMAAALVFALVGIFFPALVTLVTFASNERLGPSVTGTLSSTAPLFALAAAFVFLGERIPPRALVATAGVVAGVALISWRGGALVRRALWLPLLGAALRGLAQVAAKAGLALWPNPFAASAIGYVVSTAAVTTANRMAGARASATRAAIGWFILTGTLNGGAVLLMYAALSGAPVSLVAPLVAAYPLVTVLLGAAVLREEPLRPRVIGGALLIVVSIAHLVAGPTARAAEECAVPGLRAHWIADYCMARLETDDEIAASDCIGDEIRRSFSDECSAKRHYKRAMCELAVSRGTVRDGGACLADPDFAGPTVRRGGVGG